MPVMHAVIFYQHLRPSLRVRLQSLSRIHCMTMLQGFCAKGPTCVFRLQQYGGWNKQYQHRSSTLGCDMKFSVYTPPAAASDKVPASVLGMLLAYWFVCEVATTEHTCSCLYRCCTFSVG